MAPPLSERTIGVIKQTAPVLEEHAEALTRLFYERLFSNNPEVKGFFNPAHQSSGTQQRALAGALVAYAKHIDRLAALGPAVELITHKHASLGIQPEHYPIVGKNLLGAIRELLGDAATDEIIDAWAEAYGFLADVFISREAELYEEQEQRHGWRGFRPFRVVERTTESDTITSFRLTPRDGRPLGEHLPGQYLTVRIPTGDGGTAMRNYSISAGSDRETFRISVKRETAVDAGAPDGRVSSRLHDTIRVGDELELGPPCGEFVLDPKRDVGRPLVLISGGVGITPLLSMLYAVVTNGLDRDVFFIHAARNGRVHAFAEEVRALARRHPRVQVHVCYDEPAPADREARRFDTEGRVDLALLQALIPGPDADFYFCGPQPFMASLTRDLATWGVAGDRIHYECFGPLDPLEAPPTTA